MMRYEQTTTLLKEVESHARDWFASLDTRPVCATATGDELRRTLGGPLPDRGVDPEAVIRLLADAAAGGTIASAGPRYFGFVIGGSLPAATASDWLVSAWDQNAAVYAMSPIVSVIEQVTGSWLRDLAGLPPTMSVGFVTGCEMASFTGLAAARHRVLRDAAWDVEADGLFGAPPIEVIVSEEAHYAITKALRLLGLGGNRVRRIPADGAGRMRADMLADALRAGRAPRIVCAQAGNVNTGAVDPLADIAELTKAHDAWLHVDGAFGLWARANPASRVLTEGIEGADSWTTDGHKWLNTPYDGAMAICREASALAAAMASDAVYVPPDPDAQRNLTLEFSRRPRGIAIWAALRALGRSGLAELIERHCAYARRFAEGLSAAGLEVLNRVVLNQVLFRARDDATTAALQARVQASGQLWFGSTRWQGRAACRLSVSSWRTTREDIERAIAVIADSQ